MNSHESNYFLAAVKCRFINGLQCSRTSVATIARGGGGPHCNSLLGPATDTTVGIDNLGRRFCND